MPPVHTRLVPDGVLDSYDLSSPDFQLNPTTPRWRLEEGEVEEALGVNLALPDRISPVRSRVPIGTSIPIVDRPLTTAFGVNAEALVPNVTGIVLRQAQIQMNFTEIYNETYYPNGADTPAVSAGVIYADANTFVDYIWRSGDVLAINAPIELRGYYVVAGKVDARSIQIKAGLGGSSALPSANYGIAIEDAVIHQGNFYFYRAFRDDSDAAIYHYGLIKSSDLYTVEGPWTGNVKDATVVIDEDDRVPGPTTRRHLTATGFGTYAARNDTILLNRIPDVSNTSKVAVYGYREASLKGVIVSNGRKFWLLSGGVYTLVMDLGDDVYLGVEWQSARIAENRYMLVTAKFAPRILYLDRRNFVVGEQDEVLSGCVAPRKPDEIMEVSHTGNDDYAVAASWGMDNGASKGSLEAGDYAVLVRLVNPADGLASDFVKVAEATASSYPTTIAGDSLYVTCIADDGITVFPVANNASETGGAGWTPPIVARATHVEIWRSVTDNLNRFYREAVLPLYRREGNERVTGSNWSWLKPVPTHFPVQLGQIDVQLFDQLNSLDRNAVGLPPICRDVVSLLGVTYCFGKADEDRVNPTIYARNFFSEGGSFLADSYNPAVNPRIDQNAQFTTYNGNEKVGDQLVVTFGGVDETTGGSFPEGIYDVDLDNVNADKVGLDTDVPLPADTIGTERKLHYYLRRPYTIEWPFIRSDEDVWYSRMDRYAPETFPPRVRILGETGDVYRKAVALGDRIVVIMDQHVHLLLPQGVDLLKDTLGFVGMGTPWENSVVAVEDVVIWATPEGIRTLVTSSEKDDKGRRGYFGWLGGRRFRNWFREALDDGDDVDAGVDVRNRLLRFRRKSADHVYKTLVVDFAGKRWSFEDDNSGFRFALAYEAGSPALAVPALYSVEQATGAVFELGRENADPYPDLTLSGTLDDSSAICPTEIRYRTEIPFSVDLVGSILRFSNGVIRTILTAGPGYVTFDAIEDLQRGLTYQIDPLRFRLRYAPVNGRNRLSVKMCQGAMVRARPSGNRTPGNLTVRLYADYQERVESSGSVSVFDDAASGKTTEDRVVSLEGSGTALQLEIEALDAREPFDLELVRVDVFESLDKQADVEE